MYSVAQNIKDSIVAPSRLVKGRVTLDISDLTAYIDVSSIYSNGDFALSNINQINDNIGETSYLQSTWETNRTLLNGIFSFADSTIVNNGQMGYVSDEICNQSGVFVNFQTIFIFFFNVHTSIGLTIIFDEITKEYATEFEIFFYNSSNSLINRKYVTGNTLTEYVLNSTVTNYKWIGIRIDKWSVGNRRARVAEVDFGVVKRYTDDTLISFNFIDDMDLSSSTVPTTELKFVVDNSDRAFNILNPTGFYTALKKQQRVEAELGIEVNGLIKYIPLGKFLLADWQTDEGALTATLTAQTNLSTMSNFTFEQLNAQNINTYTLKTMAEAVFAVCGITNFEIDSSLGNIYSKGLVKSTDCKTVLQMIALASCANIYVTRDNKIRIVVSSTTNNGSRLATITLDDMFDEAKIKLDQEVKSVVISYFNNVDTGVEVVITDPNVSSGQKLELKSNTLINTSARATIVANWLLTQKAYRATFETNFRGNPTFECNDFIGINNTYGNVAQDTIITRVEYDYQGYLSGKLQSRGII